MSLSRSLPPSWDRRRGWLPARTFHGKSLHIMEGFAAAFQSALPSFHPIDLCVGVAAALLIRLIVYVKGKKRQEIPQKSGIRLCPLGQARGYRPLRRSEV